jgi:hypothetical protein
MSPSELVSLLDAVFTTFGDVSLNVGCPHPSDQIGDQSEASPARMIASTPAFLVAV